MFKKYTLLVCLFIYSGLSVANSTVNSYKEGGIEIVIYQQPISKSLSEKEFNNASDILMSRYVLGLKKGFNDGFKNKIQDIIANSPNASKQDINAANNLEYSFFPYKTIKSEGKTIVIVPGNLIEKNKKKNIIHSNIVLINSYIEGKSVGVFCISEGQKSISMTSGPCAKAIKKTFGITIGSKDIAAINTYIPE